MTFHSRLPAVSAALALAGSLATLAAAPADAQGARHCGDRDRIVARLAESFGESRQSIGLGANNSVMEVFASTETGTWTITVTMPNGVTCLIATGQAFETLNEEVPAAEHEL